MADDNLPSPPGVKPYAMLTFTFDSGDKRLKLSLSGPELPAVGGSPAIGVARDENGKYHFLIGSGDTLVDPSQLSSSLKKLLGDKSDKPGPARPIPMPPASKIKRSDGSYLTFGEFDRLRKMFHSPVGSIDGTVWEEIPEVVYNDLVRNYKLLDAGGTPDKK